MIYQGLNLIIHNILSIGSAIIMLGIAFFSFFNKPKKTENVTFSVMTLMVFIFIISHLIGVNIQNPYLSKTILMFNLSILFIGSFYLHTVLAILGMDKEKKFLINFIHFSALLIVIFFIIFPETFLKPSVPKMYFPNYYNPGELNLIRLLFLNGITVPYGLYIIYQAYRREKNIYLKNQYKYFFVGSVVGFGSGFIPNFLVYDIEVDPLWGMSFALLLLIPFVYGAVRYEMLNIKVIAKQAAFYTLTVIIMGGLITALNYLDSWLKDYPSFPRWILTLISASLVVIMGIIIWYHLRKEDILKYEMITTIAHRFRTPLTRIKWAVDNLLKSNLDKLSLEQVEQIKISNLKLIELTNFLSKIPEWEKSARYYNFQESNFSKVAEEAIDYLTNQAKRKNLTIIKKIQDNLKAVFDVEKIKFVIHILADNAINYTPQNGTITFLVYQKEDNIICEIKDTGIGIPKEDLLLLFSKFYRGKLARSIDTEGLGIGLYLAREIINHHKGKIWVESEGLNKGSTFKFSIKSIK